MSWKELSRASLSKNLLNLVGAGTTLGQSANWRALFVGFPPLARAVHWETAPMEKGGFLGVFLQEMSSGHIKSILRGI